jgi:hypothetical protein
MPDALKRRPREEPPVTDPDDNPMEGEAPSG